MTITDFLPLFRVGITTRITRIYSDGWDENIGAWQEEVAEVFNELCRFYGDDPQSCRLVARRSTSKSSEARCK